MEPDIENEIFELRRGGSSRSSSSRSSSHGVGGGSNGDFRYVGFVFGLLMIMCAIPMAWFIEQNKVKISKLIHKAEKACVPNVPINQANPDFDHKLIHCTG